jgi:uncharacterized surface protein with fasciclin (FAS1) repeats
VANQNLLVSVLRYHVIPTTILSKADALAAAGTAKTLLTAKTLAMSGS